MIRNKDDYLRISIFCLFIAVTYQFIFAPLGILNDQKSKLNDLLIRFDYSFFKKEPPRNILIVKIDDNSINKIGLKWPWPRQTFARLVDKLKEADVSVIGFDMIFSGESSFGKDDDEALAVSLKNSSSAVLAAYFNGGGNSLFPLESLEKSAVATGFVNKLKDNNNLVRRAQCIFLSKAGREDYPFEFKLLGRFLNFNSKDIRLENRRIIFPENKLQPVKLGNSITVPLRYAYKFNDFESVSFVDVLEGKVAQEILKNKIAVVSQTAEILHDIHPTPLGQMPGVGILANFSQQLLSGSTPLEVSQFITFLGLVWFSVLVGLIVLVMPGYAAFLIVLVLNLFFIYLGILAYHKGFIIDIFGYIFTNTVILTIVWGYRYILFMQNKNRLIKIAIKDGDTGIFNHHYFSVRLSDEVKVAQTKRRNLSCICLEIANFSEIVNEFERPDISIFLRSLVRCLKEAVPRNIFLARFAEDKIFVFTGSINKAEFEKIIKIARTKTEHLFIKSDLKEISKEAKVILGGYFQSSGNVKPASLILYYLDVALTAAKSSESGTYVMFAPREKENIDFKDKIRAGEQDILGFISEDLDERNRQLLEKIEQLKLANRRTEEAYISTLKSLLEALEAKDPYTSGHSVRVAEYALELAQEIHYPKEKLNILERAALLHDIGKIGLKDEILHKKTQLTEEEYDTIKRHEIESVKILEPIAFLKMILPAILHHHEHFDGSGYPHGLRGEMIPLESRIIAIADSFDAMTTGRGYNNPLDKKEAIKALRESAGKQLDPALTEEFIKALTSKEI